MGEYQGGVYPSSLVRKALPLTPPSSQRVAKAAASILGTTGDIAHEALLLSVDVLEFAPVLGLQQAARTLLGIWDALQMVDVSAFLGSRLGFLRVLSLVAWALQWFRRALGGWVGFDVSTWSWLGLSRSFWLDPGFRSMRFEPDAFVLASSSLVLSSSSFVLAFVLVL